MLCCDVACELADMQLSGWGRLVPGWRLTCVSCTLVLQGRYRRTAAAVGEWEGSGMCSAGLPTLACCMNRSAVASPAVQTDVSSGTLLC
jgi:hypothetical protein